MPLYLLHFDRPYRHARHYLGYASTLEAMHRRIDRHYDATPGDGDHHRLMQVIRQAGISFTLARVWPAGTRADEKKKKQRGHARHCPICRDLKGQQAMYGHETAKTERIDERNVDAAFQYQPWNEEQVKAGAAVRAALVEATKAILANVPETPLRTRAINCLVDARMLANAAITFNGQF